VQPTVGDPASAGGVGLDDPQRSLPTPTILWFCDSVTGFLLVVEDRYLGPNYPSYNATVVHRVPWWL